MAGSDCLADAFTAGVKPGGLTSSTEIRILLCYLIKAAGPLTREAMQAALLQEELVNYFEFASALEELSEQHLVASVAQGYLITEKGSVVADTLSDDLPRSVRDSAIRAVIRMQSWVHKAAQNQASVLKTEKGYQVQCQIHDMGTDAFSLSLLMPDQLTADTVRNQFIAHGSEIYSQLLNGLTQPGKESDDPPDGMK
jgi:hypothetical protein